LANPIRRANGTAPFANNKVGNTHNSFDTTKHNAA
jgi:hypothetical protein